MSVRVVAVTDSLAAPESLEPHLVELFRGIPSLGSSPRAVTRLLREAEVKRTSAVLDLACGKGTLALTVASTIGCKVVAVDAHAPFIEEGRRNAHRRGLEHLVQFRCEDVERWKPSRRFDAVTMLGLWPVDMAVPRLRRLVKAGGVYIVDDLFFDPGRVEGEWTFKQPPTLEETDRRVREYLDKVERVLVPRPGEVAAQSARMIERLTRNAVALAESRPELRRTLFHFIYRHERAARAIVGPCRPAIWVVRRGLRSRQARRRRL